MSEILCDGCNDEGDFPSRIICEACLASIKSNAECCIKEKQELRDALKNKETMSEELAKQLVEILTFRIAEQSMRNHPNHQMITSYQNQISDIIQAKKIKG